MDPKKIVNVEVFCNIDELLQKVERFNEIMKEAKTLADEIASMDVELEFKI